MVWGRTLASGLMMFCVGGCLGGSAIPDPVPDGAALPDGSAPDAALPDAAEPGAPDAMLAPPVAAAGADQTVHTTATVSLSGEGSHSPRAGATLTYAWSFVSGPPGSTTSLTGATSATPSFVPDRNGRYVVSLVVNDGTLASAPDTVAIQANNAAPISNAGADASFYGQKTVTLSSDGSYDPDGDSLSLAWTLISRPAGSSAALSSSSAAAPTFVADVDGSYTVRLVVTDALGATGTDTVVLSRWHPLVELGYAVRDAELSGPLDKLVLLSGSTLHIVDPHTGAGTTVELPLAGTAVSVGPDGTHAVVGHNAWVSYVRLTDATLLATYAVSAPVGDVVLAGNGYAYAFPDEGQWTNIHSIRLSDGFETLSTSSVREDTVARLHPTQLAVYGANNGLSPSDIEKYTIASGPAAVLYDSPYHGDYPMCGDLWIADDGDKILTRCGRVFWSTGVKATDMTYAGALPLTFLRTADHSAAAGAFVVVPMSFGTGGDGTVRIFEDQFLNLVGSRGPTRFLRDDGSQVAEVGFVFFSPDGDEVYFVAVPPGGGEAGLVVY